MGKIIIRFLQYGFDITGKLYKQNNVWTILGKKQIDGLIINCLESEIELVNFDVKYKKHQINGELKIYDNNNIYTGIIQVKDKKYKELTYYDSDDNSNAMKKLVVNLSNRPLYPLGLEVNATFQLKIEIY